MTIKSLKSRLKLLFDSHQRLIGRPLVELSSDATPDELCHALDEGPFMLVSHGTEANPIFNYGNKTALRLFGMSWNEFTSLPSSHSAEQSSREGRAQLMQEVKDNGFVEGYSGVRIAKDGSRFTVEGMTIWNVVDDEGRYHGQAAVCREWHYL